MAESRKRAILGSATIDFGSVADGAADTATATVKGVRAGQVVVVNAVGAEAGLVVDGYASGDDEVTIRVTNASGGAVDAADQEFLIAVIA